MMTQPTTILHNIPESSAENNTYMKFLSFFGFTSQVFYRIFSKLILFHNNMISSNDYQWISASVTWYVNNF